MRLRAWLALLLLIAAALAAMPVFMYGEQTVPLPQARRDLLSTAQEVLLTHPAFALEANGAAMRRAYLFYVRRLSARLSEPLTSTALLEDEDLVLDWLKDPHTNLAQAWSPLSSTDLLPVGFYWTQGGLVAYRVAGSPGGIETGDRVLAIGGVPTRDLLSRLRRFYSGNVPWLQTLADTFLPYGNTLAWLGLEHDGRVDLSFERSSGERFSLRVALRPIGLSSYESYELGHALFLARYVAPPGLMRRLGDSFYAWRVTPDYGIYWLVACQDTSGFEHSVSAFFSAVKKAHVGDVVIDLQENMGGDADVAFAFLRHLPLQAGYQDLQSAQSPDEIFRGKVYVLVNGATMSSGVQVAEYLTEAGDGVLTGSPAGLASAAWGEVQYFATPDGRMDYQVSSMWIPAVDGRVTPTLRPSIALPLTVEDVREGRNPLAAWLGHLPSPVAPCT